MLRACEISFEPCGNKFINKKPSGNIRAVFIYEVVAYEATFAYRLILLAVFNW